MVKGEGVIYTDSHISRELFIAFVFGSMQGLMPLIGYWLVEGITVVVDEAGGAKAGEIMSKIVSWTAFALLIFLGTKMIVEAIKEMKKDIEQKTPKMFSYKEVLYFGIVTSIDALGSGVALHSGLSNNKTVWLHVCIIMVCTFTISLIGFFLGNKIEKLLKGKYEITGIIGGTILVLLGIFIILSHYINI